MVPGYRPYFSKILNKYLLIFFVLYMVFAIGIIIVFSVVTYLATNVKFESYYVTIIGILFVPLLFVIFSMPCVIGTYYFQKDDYGYIDENGLLING